MNQSNFVQLEGYPLTADRLQELQNSFQIFNALGALAGNLTIISGCETIGSTVKSGVVFINNEVLEFREAGVSSGSRVIIIEEKTKKSFKNGTIKEVYTTRYATFGTAAVSWAWSEFKRPVATKEVQPILDSKADKTTVQTALDSKADKTAVQPVLDSKADSATLTALIARVNELEKKNAVFQASGGMVLWNKPANQIPAGWQEVVDFRGRMPVGFNPNTHLDYRDYPPIEEFDDPEFANWNDRNGGSKKHQLTEKEIPRHMHKYNDIYFSENPKVVNTSGLDYTAVPKNTGAKGDVDYDNLGFQMKRETEHTGNSNPFSILNPYRVVLFIEYIG